MDRGKNPLKETVGEWTTVHRKPNKGKAESNSKKGFVPAQIPFYPNQGYYVSYPMVNQPLGPNVLKNPMVNQPVGNSFSNMVYQSPMSNLVFSYNDWQSSIISIK
ncbi:hypothetical protein Gotur_003127 [Gossypium turneri]